MPSQNHDIMAHVTSHMHTHVRYDMSVCYMHAICTRRELLKTYDVDINCRGEGELTALQLAM